MDLRERCRKLEILDGIDVAEDVRERCYADLARTHRWLGYYAAILARLLRDHHRVNGVCRRFLILDLARHWIPLLLFRAFVAPTFRHVVAPFYVRQIVDIQY